MANEVERLLNAFHRAFTKMMIHLTGILMLLSIIQYIEYMFKCLLGYGICLCVGCPTEIDISIVGIAIAGYEDLSLASLSSVNSPSNALVQSVNSPSLANISSTNSISNASLSSVNSLSKSNISSVNSLSNANVSAITSVSIVASA